MSRTRSLWLLLGAVAGAAAVAPARGAALPTSPARVQAFPGTGAVLITFSTAQNATGYNVYRRPANEAADKAAKVNAQPTANAWLIDDGGGAGLPNGAALLYFVKAVMQDGSEGAASQEVVVTPQVPVLGSFFSHDIGTTFPSSVAVEGTTLTFTASGHELWNADDGGAFLGTAIAGDYTISAKLLERQEGGHPGAAKVGVMIREGLTPGDRYAICAVLKTRGVYFEGRTNILGTEGSALAETGLTNDEIQFPIWLRLTKAGSTISAFSSLDGSTYEQVGSDRDYGAMQPVTYVGLGASAVHVNNPDYRYVTAKFDATSIKIE